MCLICLRTSALLRIVGSAFSGILNRGKNSLCQSHVLRFMSMVRDALVTAHTHTCMRIGALWRCLVQVRVCGCCARAQMSLTSVRLTSHHSLCHALWRVHVPSVMCSCPPDSLYMSQLSMVPKHASPLSTA